MNGRSKTFFKDYLRSICRQLFEGIKHSFLMTQRLNNSLYTALLIAVSKLFEFCFYVFEAIWYKNEKKNATIRKYSKRKSLPQNAFIKKNQ